MTDVRPCVFESGMTMVKKLMHEEGNILSFDGFQRKFQSTRLDLLTYHGLISSIKYNRQSYE